MKNSILIAFVLLSTFSLANDIDSRIDAIEKASTPQERVRLVNEFKITLANMSANDRAEAINQLRSSMQGSKNTQMMQTRMHSQMHQMNEIQNTISNQVMQQQNAISQAVSNGIRNMGSGIINPINNNNGGAGNGNGQFPIQH